jgi:hypothetical protein
VPHRADQLCCDTATAPAHCTGLPLARRHCRGTWMKRSPRPASCSARARQHASVTAGSQAAAAVGAAVRATVPTFQPSDLRQARVDSRTGEVTQAEVICYTTSANGAHGVVTRMLAVRPMRTSSWWQPATKHDSWCGAPTPPKSCTGRRKTALNQSMPQTMCVCVLSLRQGPFVVVKPWRLPSLTATALGAASCGASSHC